MAKALAQGARTVSNALIDANTQSIEELRKITAGGDSEARKLWHDWQLIQQETGNRDQNSHASLTRLSRLPMMRKPLYVISYLGEGSV